MPGGYPWSQGDLLLANDLNAAIANMPALAGAPFLPLSGGTVTGQLNLTTNQTAQQPQPSSQITYGLTTPGGDGLTGTAFQLNASVADGVGTSLWASYVNLTVNSHQLPSGWPAHVASYIGVIKNASAQSWGALISVTDTQNLPSSTAGGFNGLEFGLEASGADDATGSGGGSRRGIDMIVSPHTGGPAGVLGNGVIIRTNGNATVTNAFHAYAGQITNGFVADSTATGFLQVGAGNFGLNTSGATLAGPAILLASGQKIAFEASQSVIMSWNGSAVTLSHPLSLAQSLGIGGVTGPTWTTGSAAPSSTQPVGSLYSRVSTWAAGATLYVSKGGGAWTAVASV